jgi:protein ImuA
MQKNKADIFAQLKRDILPLQGIKSILPGTSKDHKLGAIRYAFPNAHFPLGAIHEFLCEEPENAAATAGFIGSLISLLLKENASIIWVSAKQTIFPPALVAFGLSPEKVIFIHPEKENQLLWIIEEALKCKGLSAVVGEISDLSFTASRKLQLAVEGSGVTGFIMRCKEKNIQTSASVTRWKIQPTHSISIDGLPGVGYPSWNVDLLKVRNGKPAEWKVAWAAGMFVPIREEPAFIYKDEERKTG